MSAVNLSVGQLLLSLSDCLSGHAGNSIEAMLNNDRIIFVYEKVRHRKGLFVCLDSHIISCQLHFPWFSGGCLRVVLSAHIHDF